MLGTKWYFGPDNQDYLSQLTQLNKDNILTNIYKEESSVTRALCFLQKADEYTRTEVFSHEWTSNPISLVKPDSQFDNGYGMIRGNKSDCLSCLL
jgi:hypothetical protein